MAPHSVNPVLGEIDLFTLLFISQRTKGFCVICNPNICRFIVKLLGVSYCSPKENIFNKIFHEKDGARKSNMLCRDERFNFADYLSVLPL